MRIPVRRAGAGCLADFRALPQKFSECSLRVPLAVTHHWVRDEGPVGAVPVKLGVSLFVLDRMHAGADRVIGEQTVCIPCGFLCELVRWANRIS